MKKLTEQVVKAIKEDICKKKPQKQIARIHNVSRSTVSDIATDRIHKNVPWPSTPPVKKAGGQRKPIEDVDPTNRRILELEAEIVHLTQEKNLERRRAMANAKTDGIYRSMVSVLKSELPAFKPLPRARSLKGPGKMIEEHAVMHLSDGHHDQVIVPEECGGLENYNFPISCCRAERYVNTTIDWTQSTLREHHFSHLWILAYGDHTSGEIHGHVARSYFRNQFKNTLAIAQLHAMMFRDLAPHFDRVHVVYVPGNHGRRSPKKDHHGAHDNWDYLVGEAARLHCRDIENIEFLIPDSYSVNLDINNVGFNVFHGDDVRGSSGMPYYGLQRRQKNLIAMASKQAGPRVRYFCCGHFHKPGSVGDMDGELMVNGPWPATDAYAFNSFAGFTEPSQWLHGVNPRYGITWRMDVKLREPEKEKLGPQRYKIDPA